MQKVIIVDIKTEREDLRNFIGGTGYTTSIVVKQPLIISNIEKNGITCSGIRTSPIRIIQKFGDYIYVMTHNSTYKLKEAK